MEAMIRYRCDLAIQNSPWYCNVHAFCATANQVIMCKNATIMTHEEHMFFIAWFTQRTKVSTPMVDNCAACTGVVEEGDSCILFPCSHGVHPSCFLTQPLLVGWSAICGCHDSTIIYGIVYGDPALFYVMPY
uniref:RING-type domain-containing protein n=1 Tax=Trichuris muris TaxID=70415 RepID=A0A5S6QCN1_TRIMR